MNGKLVVNMCISLSIYIYVIIYIYLYICIYHYMNRVLRARATSTGGRAMGEPMFFFDSLRVSGDALMHPEAQSDGSAPTKHVSDVKQIFRGPVSSI